MNTLCMLSKAWAPLLGRILIAIIFLQSGMDKIMNFSKTAGFMVSKGMPMAEVLLVPTIIIVLGGGLMLLFGWHARWAALAMALFLIPTTLIFHPYWAYPEAQQVNQFHHFFKNLAIMGGLFVIVGMGPGPKSLGTEPKGN
jgi:putative oxidoreductase